MNNIFWVFVLLLLINIQISSGLNASTSNRPSMVNIGAIFSFNSAVGKVAKVAIEAAVEDVNSNPQILGGTELNMTMHNTNHSGFLGIAEAFQFMESDTVAIIGPQSSVIAHVISNIASELQVPLLSFAATDPTLSSLQFPFFVRTTQNDLYQMAAITDIIEYYGWKAVVAIYVDDDFGRNGIASLADQLALKRCSISYKAPLTSDANRTEITDVLVKVALADSRIIIVHTYSSWGLEIFSVAEHLGMMESGYAWIATNWLSTVLDTESPPPHAEMDHIQGVITLRMYTPDSELKRSFVSRWKNLTKETGNGSFGLNTYGLYAYDTVWLVAHAINAFFDQGGLVSFSKDSRLSELRNGRLHLEALSIFDGGKLLLDNVLKANFTGLTGLIGFGQDRSPTRPAYEVINVIGTGVRQMGYWSNYSGLSVEPPQMLYSMPPNRSSSNQQLHDVIWPGQTIEKPRGWVFPNNGKVLRIGVPNRISYREFIALEPGTDQFKGYCLDVFTSALSLFPYAVPYKLIPFGDGRNNPNCTELVRLITTGEFDAGVGDIAIITNRTKMVDFTQPFIESGLVVVAPVSKTNSGAWSFFRPFTPKMWIVTTVFFLFTGIVVWILEHRINSDFRGPPKRQIVTIFWFSFSTLFFAHKEKPVSALGRIVLILWLFVVLIINSSYTASLTSILTVQQLHSPIKGIDSLIASKDKIGIQHGSFALSYLTDQLNIHESRIVQLNSANDYAEALKRGPKNGGVAAVIDERAYIELFLSTRCEFSILGHEFTKAGWGFAFPRDSPLAIDMSTAILQLSENGDLQRIHDKWLMSSACSSQDSKLAVDRLELKSFSGLFMLCGFACLLALCIYFFKMVRQFSRYYSDDLESSGRSSGSARLQTFISFADEKEESVKSRSKKRQLERGSMRSDGEAESVSNLNKNLRHSEVSPTVSFDVGA